MHRHVVWGAAALLISCGTDPQPGPGTELDTDVVADTAGPGGDVFAELPDDVDAACWSWMREDWEANGSYDNTELRVYDPGTLALRYFEYDDGPNGEPDQIAVYDYDSTGQYMVDWTYDLDGDGTIDVTYHREYVDGLRVLHQVDGDGDGRWDEVWTYAYEGQNRSLVEVDEGDDGQIDIRYHYTHDAADRVLRIEGDRGDDGIDEIFAYTYVDESGPDVTETWDVGADGLIEQVSTLRYNALGDVRHYEWSDAVFGDAWTYDYVYDPNRDPVAIVGTVWAGSEWYYDFEYAYSYLAPGKVEASRFDADLSGDGQWDYATVQEWTWTCP